MKHAALHACRAERGNTCVLNLVRIHVRYDRYTHARVHASVIYNLSSRRRAVKVSKCSRAQYSRSSVYICYETAVWGMYELVIT
jgi:hypothetical protein